MPWIRASQTHWVRVAWDHQFVVEVAPVSIPASTAWPWTSATMPWSSRSGIAVMQELFRNALLTLAQSEV
ncbi:hypothetical protein J2X46_004114 [Nocardioides sp. BE266]|nr:hypothetical protein [Nocardioides sp. BE266]